MNSERENSGKHDRPRVYLTIRPFTHRKRENI